MLWPFYVAMFGIWGNSAAVPIPAGIMRASRLELDHAVDVHEEDGLRCARRQATVLVARGYVPEAGDIVWLRFNPQSGHEQAGHRPALVLSAFRLQWQDRSEGVLPNDNANKRLSV